jgi:hypothetical protein
VSSGDYGMQSREGNKKALKAKASVARPTGHVSVGKNAAPSSVR